MACAAAADDGPCPNSTCPAVGDMCNVRLTGEFYCQCVRDCVTREPADKSNNDLWALFVIPFVVVIILLILLIIIYRRRQTRIVHKKVCSNERLNRLSGSRVTGSAIWVRVGSGHGSKPGFLTRILNRKRMRRMQIE